MRKSFSVMLFFILVSVLFGTQTAHAEIKPGLPKLYLNDVELSSELYIQDRVLYLKGSDLPAVGAKVVPYGNDSQRILIGNTELRLDLPSGIASVYQIDSSSFLPKAYTVINFEKRGQNLWFSLKDLAPYLGFRYHRISDVDLFRLTDGTETITPAALFEINTTPAVAPTVPASGPNTEDGKTHSPSKGDKNHPAGKKVVYLTFDDGPNKQTKEILRLLKKYNMKATFFMLYNGISTEPDLVKQIDKEGHGIGLHGVTHRKNLFYKDATAPLKEMDGANKALKKVLGVETKLVRTPYGSKPYMSDAQYAQLVDNDYLLWDWNVDSGDSAKNYVAPKVIETRVITGLKAKATPVVLLHDKTCTVDSLEAILSWMSKNGYISKPLTEDMAPLNWSN